MENRLDELSHVSGSRLRHKSSVARGYAESQTGKRTKTAQHSASESRGTQGRQSSTVCSRGDQQAYDIGGCTDEVTPQDLWEGTKTVLLEVARETIGSVKSQKKKKWISDETYAAIMEKRESKGKDKNRYKELKARGTEKAQSG